MTDEPASEVHRRAVALSRDDREVVGPLKGYHHEAYAFPLPAGNPLRERFERGKLRAPRPGVLWYDRRCFASEDELLRALRGRISRIPETMEVADGFHLQGFIEGRTLGAGALSGHSLSPRHERQLGRLFGELVAVKTDELDGVARTCPPGGPPPSGEDSAAFLDRLAGFTRDQVYGRNEAVYGELFDGLGVRPAALDRVGSPAAGRLANRPFALLHGDLHRRNLIVDTRGDLWTIDWELAMIGDPLYELATHLHLMGYHRREERRVGLRWATAVESVLPGSTRAWVRDLPALLAYKRTQSVFTDVIRTAAALGPRSDPNWKALPGAAWKVRRALIAAREPLGLAHVPSLPQVMAVYRGWLRSGGG
ncbi:aminoglycoside phosphotransferase family protein [Streptomyces sp. CAU 1734]|uniref:aminoglycoside phosphotransferase family protein n=1 Tax=Streptomyces sp. CAU 1734 TaxID=3140360 RepID=UPI00325FFD2E